MQVDTSSERLCRPPSPQGEGKGKRLEEKAGEAEGFAGRAISDLTKGICDLSDVFRNPCQILRRKLL